MRRGERYDLRRGTIYQARAEDVYADLEPGFTLAILDGPYGMSKAAWDRMSLDDLPGWYEPHLRAVSGLLAPSASLYLWNTAEGWARIDPVVRALGWRFRSLIVWHKIGAHPALIGAANSTSWPDITEVAGHYQRGSAVHVNDDTPNVWPFSPTGMKQERLYSGALKVGKIGGRLEAEALHPCQKPLVFAERMIRASSRPGDQVLSVFSGTCREAVVCERLPEPEARRYVCIEADEDGRDYIRAVLPSLRLEPSAGVRAGQVALFGGAAGWEAEREVAP